MLCNTQHYVRILRVLFQIILITFSRTLYSQGETMRLLLSLFILLFAVACGKSGSSSSDDPQLQADNCLVNDEVVTCETIRGNDPSNVNLLESMIDVNVTISGTSLIFPVGKSSVARGSRINCPTAVSSGEVYQYLLRGNSLDIQTPTQSYTMERLSDGTSIVGVWVWKGYEAGNVYTIRSLSFVNNTRVIMKTHCEL